MSNTAFSYPSVQVRTDSSTGTVRVFVNVGSIRDLRLFLKVVREVENVEEIERKLMEAKLRGVAEQEPAIIIDRFRRLRSTLRGLLATCIMQAIANVLLGHVENEIPLAVDVAIRETSKSSVLVEACQVRPDGSSTVLDSVGKFSNGICRFYRLFIYDVPPLGAGAKLPIKICTLIFDISHYTTLLYRYCKEVSINRLVYEHGRLTTCRLVDTKLITLRQALHEASIGKEKFRNFIQQVQKRLDKRHDIDVTCHARALLSKYISSRVLPALALHDGRRFVYTYTIPDHVALLLASESPETALEVALDDVYILKLSKVGIDELAVLLLYGDELGEYREHPSVLELSLNVRKFLLDLAGIGFVLLHEFAIVARRESVGSLRMFLREKVSEDERRLLMELDDGFYICMPDKARESPLSCLSIGRKISDVGLGYLTVLALDPELLLAPHGEPAREFAILFACLANRRLRVRTLQDVEALVHLLDDATSVLVIRDFNIDPTPFTLHVALYARPLVVATRRVLEQCQDVRDAITHLLRQRKRIDLSEIHLRLGLVKTLIRQTFASKFRLLKYGMYRGEETLNIVLEDAPPEELAGLGKVRIVLIDHDWASALRKCRSLEHVLETLRSRIRQVAPVGEEVLEKQVEKIRTEVAKLGIELPKIVKVQAPAPLVGEPTVQRQEAPRQQVQAQLQESEAEKSLARLIAEKLDLFLRELAREGEGEGIESA